MKNVYLAGPIGGCSYDEATEWRNYIQSMTPSIAQINFISPMRNKEFLKEEKVISQNCKEYEGTLLSNQKSIFYRDSTDIINCDIIFVYLPKTLNDKRPSLGTVWEIGFARALNKPIILVTDDPIYANHPILNQSCGWVVNTLDHGLFVLNSIMNPY